MNIFNQPLTLKTFLVALVIFLVFDRVCFLFDERAKKRRKRKAQEYWAGLKKKGSSSNGINIKASTDDRSGN